jgi:hypothetical protein
VPSVGSHRLFPGLQGVRVRSFADYAPEGHWSVRLSLTREQRNDRKINVILP